jgi:ubiquinol-cytochrome c reductase cytochrome c1 subunit
MKKIILTIIFSVVCSGWSVSALASGGDVHLDKAEIVLGDQQALQRGAKLFVSYCMGCHSIKYMSYQRMAQDIGMTEEEVANNLMLPGARIGDYMKIAMPETQSVEWFGVQPPDLSVISRSRGTDWLYTYLRSFYVDESRPFGVNNRVFKDVAMPHVMWELEGAKKAIFEEVKEGDLIHLEFKGYERISAGSMTPAEFDKAMLDLTSFLDYVGEPVKLKRHQLGFWVLTFLAILLVISYMLKKEYWKDIH